MKTKEYELTGPCEIVELTDCINDITGNSNIFFSVWVRERGKLREYYLRITYFDQYITERTIYEVHCSYFSALNYLRGIKLLLKVYNP